MCALDLAAALALGAGTFLGARKGLWRMLAGGGAVSLGTFAGMAASGVLAPAFADFGVVYPGGALLGFFLPFALVSVCARYVLGLWLSRRLDRRPERNRALGAAAGALWTVLALGLVTRAAGFGPDEGALAKETGRPGPCRPDHDVVPTGPPFCRWLARYPGAAAARLRPTHLLADGARPGRRSRRDEHAWERAIKTAIDGRRVQARAAAADREAISSMRQALRGRQDETGNVAPPRPVRLHAPVRVPSQARTGGP